MLRERLVATERLLRSLDPSAVLERGYVMVTENGRPRTSIAGLAVGAALRVRFKDGEAGTRVVDLGKKEEEPEQGKLL